jgi:TP901 family phage tail tape measure protein
MAKGANLEYVAKLMMGLDVDKKDIQAAEKQGAQLAKAVGEEFAKGFKNFGNIINSALAKANIKPIDLDKIFDPRDVVGTLDNLGIKVRDIFETNIGNGIKEGINTALRSSMLKNIDELNAAYGRNKNASGAKTGINVRSGLRNAVKKAFEYEPSDKAIGIGRNLSTIKGQFEKATNWEEQYVALLKYIKAYEALERITSDPKSLDKWKMIGEYTIDNLKAARPEIEHSLQNIFNVAYGKAVTGFTNAGDIDLDVKLTPIKMIDVYDVVKGGQIEVEVVPVVKKAKENATPNMFRGVHEPGEYEGKRINRETLGANYWADPKSEEFIARAYGDDADDDGRTIKAYARPLNTLEADAKIYDKDGKPDYVLFNEIDKIKMLQHLFPGVEKFKNVADPGGGDAVQKFYNEMARQAGFDMFNLNEVDEGGGEVAFTKVPLQERVLEYIGNIPDYLDIDKFTPEMERDIISRQKGSAERWYNDTISRLEGEYIAAQDAKDIGLVTELSEVLNKVKTMRESAMKAFDKEIVKYGGYNEDAVKQGLPKIIDVNEDGDLVGKITEDALRSRLEQYADLLQKSDADINNKSLQNQVNEVQEQILATLPKKMQDDAFDFLNDFAYGDRSLDEAMQYFSPHLTYQDDIMPSVADANQIAEAARKTADETERKAQAEKEVTEAQAKAKVDAEEERINSRRDELVKQMESLGDEDGDFKSLKDKKQQIQEILGLLQKEDLLTGEVVDKYNEINQSLDNRLIESLFHAPDAVDADKKQKILTQDEAFKGLTDYIGRSGKTPNQFFDDMISGSQHVDSELKNILTTLGMIDSQGSINLKSIDNGFTNLGGAVSDTYTLISRTADYLPKAQDLMPKLAEAKKLGANVGTIEDIVTDEATNRIYELQKTVSGEGIRVSGNTDFLEATDEQVLKLIKDLEILQKTGLYIDFGGDNILYDKEKGFSFIDLATRPQEGQETIEDNVNKMLGFFKSDFGDDSRFGGFASKLTETLSSEIPQAANKAEVAIDEVNNAIKEMDNLGKGTGDASSAELEKLRAENENLKKDNKIAYDYLDEKEKELNNANQKLLDQEFDQVKVDEAYLREKELADKVEIANKRAQEAELENKQLHKALGDSENELARMKADADGKKLVDKDAPDDDSEIRSLRAQLENEREQRRCAESMENAAYAREYEAEEEARQAKEEADKLRRQLADKTTDDGDVQAADTSKEMADMKALQEAVEGVTAAAKAQSEAFDTVKSSISAAVSGSLADLEILEGKLKGVQDLFQNIQPGQGGSGSGINIDISAQLSTADLATESTLSSVLGAVNSIDGKVTQGAKQGKGADTQGVDNNTPKKTNNFDLDKDIAMRDLLKLRADLSTKGDLKGKRNAKINALWSDLDNVTDVAGLSKWKKEFQKYQKGLKIGSVFDKAYQDTDAVAYKQLIALKKSEYDLETKMLKAKGPEERSVYAAQLDAVRELISQQKILHKNMEYENQLAQIQEKHQANIAAIEGKKTDAENTKRQKQEDKETIRQLEGLYEQRARAKTLGDTVEATRLRQEINAGRAKLSNIDYDTDIKFKHAAEKGRKDAITERENAALKEQEQTVSELIALYKQLGVAKTQRDLTAKNEAESTLARVEVDDIVKQIADKRKSLPTIDTETEDLFEKTEIDSSKVAAFNELLEIQKKIGVLNAEIDKSSGGEQLNNLREQLQIQEQLYDAIKRRLALTANEEDVLSATRDDAWEKKIAQIEGKAAQTADKERQKIQADLFRQQIKQSQEAARLSKASSTWKSGDDALYSLWKIDDPLIDVSQLADVQKLQTALDELKQKINQLKNDGGIVSDADAEELKTMRAEVDKYADSVNNLIKNHDKFSSDGAIDLGRTFNSSDNAKSQLEDAVKQMYGAKASIKGYDDAAQELRFEMKTGANEFTSYTAGIRQTDGALKAVATTSRKTETFFESMGRKAREIASYISVMDVYYKAMEWTRQGIQYVREIDTAMTELKKVTNETEASYDSFLGKASETGARIGSTIADYTNATATFAKLGYSMKTSSEMAEAALVYQNVGDGVESADAAAESIISTMKGFGLEASEAMEIVDRFNEIGNNFSITSTGIGEALKRSASALSAGGNSIDESIALITAANEVVQDPASVGTALKTLTLRLRGAKTELQEAGLEAEGMASTTSSLRAKLLALTDGKVDIMLDEDTFKNSTQILREMSQVWEEMTDIEQAAALELMGGKRQANILSSIISNFDTVEDVIQTSVNSQGSALKENEKMLDSIEGRVRQFTNSLQTMWSEAISADFAKLVVNIGTGFINLITDVGLFKTVIGTLVAIPLGKWVIQGTTSLTGYGEALKYVGTSMTWVSGKSNTLNKVIVDIWKNTDGLGDVLKNTGKSFKAFFNTPLGKFAIIAGTIWAVSKAYDALHTTLGEQKEKFTAINNEVESSESELKNLQTQLEEINTQIETLNSQDSLSFTEEQELERLQAQSAELERQIELTQTLRDAQQKELNNEALQTVDMYQDANFATGKGKGEYQQTGASVGGIAGGVAGAAGAAALGAKLTGALGTFVAGPIGTAIGVALGAVLGAVIGNMVGGAVADSKEQVGESIDNMTAKYAELKQAHESARQAYIADPMNEAIKTDYNEAEKALTDYQGAMASRMTELKAYYDSIDLSVYDPVEDSVKIKELRKEMNEFYDTQDKWAIQSGGKNAKTNAINRLFGADATDELKKVKKVLEETADAGQEINLRDAFDTAGLSGDFDGFLSRLHKMGIYAYEVEAAFKQMADAASDAMSTDMYDASKDVGGAKDGVEGVIGALETAQKTGYLTSKELDGIAETLGGAEALGDVWTHFAEVMSTNTSRLKEQREAAEALIETYLDKNIMSGGHLTPDQQHIYATQLEDMGVWNAREYIKDRDMENMFKEIQNSANYDWNKVQGKWNEIQQNWSDGSNETVQKIKQAGLNEKTAWSKLTSEQKKIIAEAAGEYKKVSKSNAKQIADAYGYEMPFSKMSNKTPQAIKDELEKLSRGGNLNLFSRQLIETDDLVRAGYSSPNPGRATSLHISSFSNTDFKDLKPKNVDDTVAINFTPIISDPETGKNIGVLSKEELTNYAHDVMAGIKEDDLNLQIGSKFVGADAISTAIDAKDRIVDILNEYTYVPYMSLPKAVSLYNDLNEKQVEFKSLRDKEEKIGGYEKQITQLRELSGLYQKMKDTYGEREYDNAIGFMSAEEVWKFAYGTTGVEAPSQEFKEQFIEDYKALENMYNTVGKDMDLSSLEEIDDKITELSGKKIRLRSEVDPEARAKLEAEIEDIEADIEASTLNIDIEFSYDIEEVKSDIEATQAAINESLSGAGMTEESVRNIRAIYGELDSYDEGTLFEKTANGIQANISALQELEYQKQKAEQSKTAQMLAQEQARYEELSRAIMNSTDIQEMNNNLAERAGVQERIESLAMLQAQYEGVTSAYNRWITAQSGSDYGDRAESVKGMLEQSDTLYNNEDYGTTEFKRATQYLTGLDDIEIEKMSITELANTYKTARAETKKYYSDNADGAYAFLSTLESIGAAVEGKDGYEISMSTEEIAEKLGRSKSMIDDMFDEMRSKGAKLFEPSLFENLDDFHGSIESIRDKVKEISGEQIKIKFDKTNQKSIDKEIEKVQNVLKESFKDPMTGKVDVEAEGYEETQQLLQYLLLLKADLNKPAVLNVATSGISDAEKEILTLMQNVATATQTVQIQTELHGPESSEVALAQTQVDTAVANLKAKAPDITTTLGLQEDASVNDITAKINSLNETQVTATITALVDGTGNVEGLNNEINNTKDKSVNVTANVSGQKDVKNLRTELEKLPSKKTVTVETRKITVNPQQYDNPIGPTKAGARGTAFVGGSAFARGNWGTKSSGTALGGELGPEIVVRDGRWFTIGDNGAEFFQYQKDDIIFNAAQSEQILEKGKITTGNRRGKAFAEGTAFATGFMPKRSKPTPISSQKTSSQKSENTKKSSDEETELERINKWYDHRLGEIEHRISINEKSINILEAQDEEISADFYYQMAQDEENRITELQSKKGELEAALKGATEYSDDWYDLKEAIRSTDEEIMSAKVSIEEYAKAVRELPLAKLERFQTLFDERLSKPAHQTSILEGVIEQKEAVGAGVSTGYYNELLNIESDNFDLLGKKYKSLVNLLSATPIDTREWYEIRSAVYEVAEAMQDSIVKVVEYRKAIIELYSDAFSQIGEAYDAKISISDDTLASMQNYMDVLELQDKIPTKGIYDAMIAENQTKLANQQEKFNEQQKAIEALYAQVNTAVPDTDEWEAFELARKQAIIAASAEQRQLQRDAEDTSKTILQLEKEWKESLKERGAQIWDDIRAAYANKATYFENQLALIDKYIGKLETLNINVPDEVYKQQIESQQLANTSVWQDYLDARKSLVEYEASDIFDPDSQEYIDMYNETVQLHQKYLDGENKVYELQQQIINNQYERFTQVISDVEHEVNKLQNISNLISRKDVANEDGEWTDEGLTRLGVAYQQMEYNKRIAEEYEDELKRYNKLLSSGKISQKEYAEKTQEIENAQWDAINAYEEQKDAIIELNEARVDMVEEGMQKEIDAYSELIELKKEALDAERNLYEFKDNIEEQTKNIATLERRIASMSGSTDAATIAERTKLQAELREAQKSLDGTYRDHAYDSMSTALDDELESYTKNSEDYIEALRESIKDTDVLIAETYSKVLNNTDVVLATITSKADEYGFYIDDYLTKPWENATSKTIKFSSYAQRHINSVYEYVEGNSGALEKSLGDPYDALSRDKDGNPLYEYSDYAMHQMDKIIESNKSKKNALITSLSEGFDKSLLAIQDWGSDTEEAVDGVINKFTDPKTGLIATLKEATSVIKSMPVYGGTKQSTESDNNSNPSNNKADSKNSGNNNASSAPNKAPQGWNQGVFNLQTILQDEFNQNLAPYGTDGKWGDTTKGALQNVQKNLQKRGWSHINTDGLWKQQSLDVFKDYFDTRIKELSGSGNGSSMVGQGIQQYKKYKDMLPAPHYAKGTMGTKSDAWGITNEPWLGEELTMYATDKGTLSFMRAGSTVVPADITANLVEWGKLDPTMMSTGDMSSGIKLMSSYISKPEVKVSFDSLVHVDHCDQGTLRDLEKMVDTKIHKFGKEMNYAIKQFK